jgi:hypothetical protein
VIALFALFFARGIPRVQPGAEAEQAASPTEDEPVA